MKKYAVGFMDFFKMDLQLEIVEASSAIDAAYTYMLCHQSDYELPVFDTVRELDTFMSDCDAAIEVKEVV